MRSVPYISFALAALFMLAACGGGGSGGKPASMTQPPVVDTDGDNADATTAVPKITTKFGKTKLDYYPLNAVNVCAGRDQCWAMVKEESNIASREEILAMVRENTHRFEDASTGIETNIDQNGQWITETVTGETYTFVTGIPVFPTPPVVRFVEGTELDARAATIRAIDNINAWLPYEKHIAVGSDLNAADSEGYKEGVFLRESYGEIWAWLGDQSPDSGGAGSGSPYGINILHDYRTNIHVIQHELLHAMGLSGGRACIETFGDACNSSSFSGPMYYYSHVPVSEFPESTMAYAGPFNDEHGLSQIDGEVLQALYTVPLPKYADILRRQPDPAPRELALEINSFEQDGTLIAIHDEIAPLSLGPWDDTVIRYSGSLGSWPYTDDLSPPAFGVDWRNGMARPWTVGETPYHTFAESGLTGSARWNGELVGFTPAKEAVHGDSAINVDLATMAGNAAFTALEHWNAGAPPGGRGTGAQWHDGDLHYTLALDGNYLRSNGGDEGYVSGRFVGEEHQGTVGILERPDLTGAFGAVRQ